jgi:hypothetical protein
VYPGGEVSAVRGVELDGAVGLQEDELGVVVGQDLEVHALAVQPALELEGQLGQVKDTHLAQRGRVH